MFLAQAATLVAERNKLSGLLQSYPGVSVFPSEANFLLIKVPDSEKTFNALLSRKILVKHTSAAHPLLGNTLRLTIGTAEENAALASALRDAI